MIAMASSMAVVNCMALPRYYTTVPRWFSPPACRSLPWWWPFVSGVAPTPPGLATIGGPCPPDRFHRAALGHLRLQVISEGCSRRLTKWACPCGSRGHAKGPPAPPSPSPKEGRPSSTSRTSPPPPRVGYGVRHDVCAITVVHVRRVVFNVALDLGYHHLRGFHTPEGVVWCGVVLVFVFVMVFVFMFLFVFVFGVYFVLCCVVLCRVVSCCVVLCCVVLCCVAMRRHLCAGNLCC